MLSEEEKRRRLALLGQQNKPNIGVDMFNIPGFKPIQQQPSRPEQQLKAPAPSIFDVIGGAIGGLFNRPQQPTPSIQSRPIQPTTIQQPIQQKTVIPDIFKLGVLNVPKISQPQQPKPPAPSVFDVVGGFFNKQKTAPVQTIVPESVKNAALLTQFEKTQGPYRTDIPQPFQANIQKSYENVFNQTRNPALTESQDIQNKIFNYNQEVKRALDYKTTKSLVDKTPVQFVNDYNNLNDAQQRTRRKQLEDVLTSYNSSFTPELKQTADKAAQYLSILSAPKEKLAELQIPEVKNKQTFGGTATDILSSIVTAPANLLGRLSITAQTALGVDLYKKIEDLYAQNQITKEERDRRISELNANVSQITGSLTGEDKGIVDRILRSVGTGAEAASYILPGAGLLKYKLGTAPLKSQVLQQGVLGAVTGGTSTFAQTGTQNNLGNIATGAAVGGLFQAAVPFGASSIEKSILRIKSKPYIEVSQAEKQFLQSQDQVHPQEQINYQDYTGPLENLGQRYAQGVQNEKQKYDKISIWRKIKNVLDPRSLALESDRTYEKLTGTKLQANDKLYNSISDMVNFQGKTDQAVKDLGVANVIKKLGNDPNFDLYLKVKRNLENVDTGGQELIISSTPDKNGLSERLSLQTQRDFIKSYEKQNPQAIQEQKVISDALQKTLYDATYGPNAYLSETDYNNVTKNADGSTKQFYIPFKRVNPEETLKVVIGGQNVGNIGRQTLLRDIQPGAQQAIDNSLQSVYDYIRTHQILSGRVKVNRIFTNRVNEGFVFGTKIVQSAEQISKLKELKLNVKEIRSSVKQLERSLKISNRQARAIAREMNAIKKEGLKEVTRKIKGGIKGKLVPEGGASLKNIAGLIEQLFTSDMATLNRLNKKFMNREPKLAAKIQEIMQTKSKIEQAKLAKQELQSQITDIRPDPTTGLQIISGIDQNGVPYKIEVTPEWANLMQGFDKQQLGKTYKAFRKVMEIAKAPIIALNPSFQFVMTLANMIMSPVYSNVGFRVWNPKLFPVFFKALSDNSEIVQKAKRGGGVSFTGNLSKLENDTYVQALAAQHDMVSRLKWYNPLTLKGLGRSYNKLNEFTGRLDRATRAVGFEAAYRKADRAGLTEPQKLAAGVEAWNTVVPDFSNVSNAIKQIDIAATFLAPTQAAVRGISRQLRERPIQTIGKLATLISPFAIITSYNMQREDMQKFYQDIKDSNKQYIYSNNLIYTLPGERVWKDEKTGEWHGIHKIPLPPELRPLAQGIVDGHFAESQRNGLPIGIYSQAVFNFLTGKFWDVSNPAYQIAMAVQTGKDVRTGRQIWDETMNDAEKRTATLRYLTKTSGVIGQMAGTFFPDNQPSKDGKPQKNAFEKFIESFTTRFEGAVGSTQGSTYFKNQGELVKKYDLNVNERNIYYGVLHPKSQDLLMNDIKDKKYTDSISKAIAYLDEKSPTGLSRLWYIDKELNQAMKDASYLSNPMFELNDQQAQSLLTIKRLADNPDRAKAEAMNNPWLKDYYKKSSEYFDNVMKNLTDEQRKKAGVDSMGVEIPRATPEMQKKLDYLSTLKTPAQKAQFYQDNPDVNDFFAIEDKYKRFKDASQGLPLFDPYPTPDKETQALIDEYNSLPKGNGPIGRNGQPTSPERSAWIKNNPLLWEKINAQWTKQDLYRLQKEGGLAQYEGVDFSPDGVKSITDIAKALGTSTGSAGFYYANLPKIERQYLTDFVSNLQAPNLAKIKEIKAKDIKKYKIKLPSTTRRTKRIRLE